MNWYYVSATFFVAMGAFFGYLGSTYNSEKSAVQSRQATKEQTERIEGELKELGNKIQALHSRPDVPGKEAEIEHIENQYNTLAADFYKKLPIEVEEFKERSAAKTIHQLQQSRIVEAHVHTLENSAKELAKAFTAKNPSNPIVVSISDFPVNIYSRAEANKYKTLISFLPNSHWQVSFSWWGDGTPALQFWRLTSKEETGKGKQFITTTDSIQLIHKVSHFEVSLNGQIADDLRQRIQSEVKMVTFPMDKFDEIAKYLLETVVKYELLQQSLRV